MSATAVELVQQAYQAYQAFGRGDIPAALNLVAEPVDWRF
jgi:uncharacterized protein with PIN domain